MTFRLAWKSAHQTAFLPLSWLREVSWELTTPQSQHTKMFHELLRMAEKQPDLEICDCCEVKQVDSAAGVHGRQHNPTWPLADTVAASPRTVSVPP